MLTYLLYLLVAAGWQLKAQLAQIDQPGAQQASVQPQVLQRHHKIWKNSYQSTSKAHAKGLQNLTVRGHSIIFSKQETMGARCCKYLESWKDKERNLPAGIHVTTAGLSYCLGLFSLFWPHNVRLCVQYRQRCATSLLPDDSHVYTTIHDRA